MFYPSGFDMKSPQQLVLSLLIGRSSVQSWRHWVVTDHEGTDIISGLILGKLFRGGSWMEWVTKAQTLKGVFCPSLLLPFSLIPEGQDETSFSLSCPWTPCAASPLLAWKLWHQEPKQACHPWCCFSCVFYHSRRAKAISFQRTHLVTLAHSLSH